MYILQEPVKLNPRLDALKIFMIFRVYCSLLFFPNFFWRKVKLDFQMKSIVNKQI